MSEDQPPSPTPAAERAERMPDSAASERAPSGEQAEHGADAYGGDTDAGPSVSETEVEAGLERDQAEG